MILESSSNRYFPHGPIAACAAWKDQLNKIEKAMKIDFFATPVRSRKFGNAFASLKTIPKRRIRFLVAFLLIVFSGLCDSNVAAQIPNRLVVVNLQSKDVELPEDFLVKVDGDKLQVALISVGAIQGEISRAGLLVRLFDSGGEEKIATTNQRGIAEFSGVKADEMHALLVSDQTVHAALPLMTVSSQFANQNIIRTESFQLPIMLANPKEVLASINRDILPPTEPAGEVYSIGQFAPKSVDTYKVRLQNDGRLLGRIVVMDQDLAEKLRYANLTFLRDNQVVARTGSNLADGGFVVDGLKEGLHGVIAAGPAGYASFAFDVLPSANRQAFRGERSLVKPVSIDQAILNEKLYVCLCPPKLVPKIMDRIREAYAGPIPVQTGLETPLGRGGSFASSASSASGTGGASGFGVGGGFGGSGFGNGGGLGGRGFAGIVGLATVAGILAANNNDNVTIASPITP